LIGECVTVAELTAKGARQGPFKAGKTKSDKIRLLKFTLTDAKPVDARGMQTGRALLTEVTIEIDAEDMFNFKDAYNTNEVLSNVEIDVSDGVGVGRGTLAGKVFETVKLTNATVKSLSEVFVHGDTPVTTISFTYQRLEVMVDGKTTISDASRV